MNLTKKTILDSGLIVEIDGLDTTESMLMVESARRKGMENLERAAAPVSDLPYIHALRPGRCIVQMGPCFDPIALANTARLILWDDGEVTALRTDGESRLLTEAEKAGVLAA